ncbi:MAG: YraN family protein [Pyrinomonadaceae bacterium]
MNDILSIFDRNSEVARRGSNVIGTRGEKLAAEFVEREGYRIVLANFKAPIGRNSKGVQVSGEIDLIALDGETICFIEVKTRRSEDFGGPLSAVDIRKQRQITRTARVYKKLFNIFEMKQRFDVVTVILEKGLAPRIELIRGFWTESKFKKPRWNYDLW